MLDLCRLIFGMVIDLLRSRVALEAEILVLRQQINVLRRTRPKRPRFISIDRLVLGSVCGLFPKVNDALAIVRPDTVNSVAPRRLQIVLALEITTSFRPTDGCGRNTTADPRDEHCQSAVGSASDPWRVAQARHRDRPDQRRQIHGQAETPAVARLENLYPQSR